MKIEITFYGNLILILSTSWDKMLVLSTDYLDIQEFYSE